MYRLQCGWWVGLSAGEEGKMARYSFRRICVDEQGRERKGIVDISGTRDPKWTDIDESKEKRKRAL
jgi:hypothetical protein